LTTELAPGVAIGSGTLPVIAGPCVIESAETTLEVARWLADTSTRLGFAPIFKSSFDKANRSSIDSFRGPGLRAGLAILAEIKAATNLPILTDVHLPEQCEAVADVCDVLQIPAFLCRQTDLIQAAASTGRSINIKKGQFVAPADMVRAVEKAQRGGAGTITVTERGYSFGYGNLVVDMRSFAILADAGVHTIYDATHSLQLPGGAETTRGDRRFAEPLTMAALAAGADGLFVEVHPDPDRARSDATTQLDPPTAEQLLVRATSIHRAAQHLGELGATRLPRETLPGSV